MMIISYKLKPITRQLVKEMLLQGVSFSLIITAFIGMLSLMAVGRGMPVMTGVQFTIASLILGFALGVVARFMKDYEPEGIEEDSKAFSNSLSEFLEGT